jgi:hypothetical protein
MFPKHRGTNCLRAVLGLALFLLLLSGTVQAQTATTDIGVFGLNRLGAMLPSLVYRPFDDVGVRPGAEALGMGGAYLASATGPLAIGWSPAGLASLKRAAISVDGFTLKSGSKVGSYPDTMVVSGFQTLIATTYRADLKGSTRANFMAAGAPLWEKGELRLAGAVSWRRFYEINMPEEFVQNLIMSRTETGYPITASVDRKEEGTIQSFAPSLAAQLGSNLALGVNFNFLNGRLHSGSTVTLTFGGAPIGALDRISFKYTGFVPDLGVRWQSFGERLALAGTFTPGYTLKVRGGGFSQSAVGTQTGGVGNLTGKEADYNIEIPMAMAGGVALRPSDRLLLALDFTQHQWSKAKVKYTETPNWFNWDGSSGPDSLALGAGIPFLDATTVHLGAEYVLMRRPWGEVPVRAGFHTAPQSVADLSRSDYSDSTYTPYGNIFDFHHNGTYNGGQIKGKAFTFGTSLRLRDISYDLGVEILSYTRNAFFFDVPWNPYFNPSSVVVEGKRHVTKIELSSTYRF